tara:strand:+ start:1373 stop:1654 length:282 start_codon:yes stop_codon:yes gene_type:complete
MRQSRFTEAQIIGMIKEQEAGMPTAEVCRRHGLSPASFYKFKAKYGGMNVSDTHRLKCNRTIDLAVTHKFPVLEFLRSGHLRQYRRGGKGRAI